MTSDGLRKAHKLLNSAFAKSKKEIKLPRATCEEILIALRDGAEELDILTSQFTLIKKEFLENKNTSKE